MVGGYEVLYLLQVEEVFQLFVEGHERHYYCWRTTDARPTEDKNFLLLDLDQVMQLLCCLVQVPQVLFLLLELVDRNVFCDEDVSVHDLLQEVVPVQSQCLHLTVRQQTYYCFYSQVTKGLQVTLVLRERAKVDVELADPVDGEVID